MMLRPFARGRDGRLELRVTANEAELLGTLMRELGGRLEEEATGSVELRRLFPPGYPDDADAQVEFARLTEGELRDGKREALRLAEESLKRARRRRGLLALELADEEQQAWLGVLNDLRLFLGTRLDVTEDVYAASPDPEDPRGQAMQVYLYLGWLEEHLVEQLLV